VTRKEKEELVRKQDGKAFETQNVKILQQTYLNPKYILSEQTANEISSTGQLNVFEIRPSGDGPSFTGRWDGGSRDAGKKERCDLDIDIDRVSKRQQRRFKKGKGGYSGHHTAKVASDTGHTYQVSLCTPDERIFDGIVCFNLLRKLGFEASISFRGGLNWLTNYLQSWAPFQRK